MIWTLGRKGEQRKSGQGWGKTGNGENRGKRMPSTVPLKRSTKLGKTGGILAEIKTIMLVIRGSSGGEKRGGEKTLLGQLVKKNGETLQVTTTADKGNKGSSQ